MKTKIEVTQECIEKGVRGSDDCCPISLALKDKTVADFISTGGDRTHIGLLGELKHYDLSEKAIAFIGAFDKGLRVEPFSFVIDIPKKYLKQ